jgi:1-phosphofructokinase family hexose kinase
MILTITPNPALDICGTAEHLVPNEKNYIRDEVHFPGGNGINVARVLTRLKVPTLATGFLGGAIGDEIRHLLDEENVAQDFVSIFESTRQSITINQLKSHCQTRLSFSGPSIRVSEARKLVSRIKQNVSPLGLTMIGGSLPKHYDVAQVRHLISAAKRHGRWVALDVPSSTLVSLVSAQPDLIKPNLFEFNEMMGERARTIREVVCAAQPLLKNVRWVCVSSVEGGAVMMTRHAAWFGKGEVIRARSSVGAGDSMVAGMLYQLSKVSGTLSKEDACYSDSLCSNMLRWGISSGMATAASPTGHLGSASKIKTYLQKVSVNRLNLRS